MKARLEGIYSIDLPDGPPRLPEDPSDCWIVVQADIGPVGTDGADTFTFYVCTLKRLQRALKSEAWQFGRHSLIVERFDWDIVESAIRRMVDDQEAADWDALAAKLGQYGQWEFADYIEASVSHR